MPDGWLRGVPTDSDPDDGRLYTQGPDTPVAGGSALRMLMGVGAALLLGLLF